MSCLYSIAKDFIEWILFALPFCFISTNNLFPPPESENHNQSKFFDMYIYLLNQWLMIKVTSSKYYHYKIFLILLTFIDQIITSIVNSHSSLYKYFNNYLFLFLQWQECNIYSTVRQVKSRCWAIKKKSDSGGRHLTFTRIKVTTSSHHLLYLKRSFTNTASNNKTVPIISK